MVSIRNSGRTIPVYWGFRVWLDKGVHCENIPETLVYDQGKGLYILHMIFYDSETARRTDAVPIPPIACGSFAVGDQAFVKHVDELLPFVERMLTSGPVIAGHYIAFDMCAIMTQWPHLTGAVFEAYEQDRVTCTEVRQKLLDIADPCCEKKDSGVWYRKRGKLTRVKYSLAFCMDRFFGRVIEGKGTTQLEYGDLINVPFELWSHKAQTYPVDDVIAPRDLYWHQEQDRHLLDDQYRQARKSFWLALMSAHGLATNPRKVDELESAKLAERNELTAQLLVDGLIRYEGPKCDPYRKIVKSPSRVRELVGRHWTDGEVPRTTVEDKSEAYRQKYPDGRVKTDADTLKQIVDCPELERYKRYVDATGFLSRDIPALKLGCNGNRIHTRFDSLKATGRTSSSKPNVQNPRRKGGVRECYEPSETIWRPIRCD